MAKKKKPRKIPEVLVFTDINNYPDSLASLVVLSWLADKNLINIRGIITELGVYEIRRRRALYAKGAMVHLGHPYLRVVPGGDYDILNEQKENNYPENEISRIFENIGTAILRSGTTFVQEYIKSAPEKNVYILLNAPFSDFAKYIKATGSALTKKIKKIIVMGDAQTTKDENSNYLPDYECYNFKIGAPAADILFQYTQENNLRLVLVPAKSVKDINMNYEFLAGLEKSKNPVAQQLLNSQNDNPLSMHYDMLSALALGDSEFKKSGGLFEQEENSEKNVFFAKVADAALLREKFCQIFQEKLMPKKITLDQLTRNKTKEEATNE